MKNNISLQWFILAAVVIATAMVAYGFYFVTKKLESYRQKEIAIVEILNRATTALSLQQKELETIKTDMGRTKKNFDQKTAVLEKTVANEREKRLGEAKKIEEKIKLAETKSAEAALLIKAREKSVQDKILALDERVSKNKTYNLAAIVSQWRPIIASVECEFRYTDTSRIYYQTGGSGIVIKFSNTPASILTNKHVVTDSNGYGADVCRAKLLDSGEVASSSDIRSSAKGYDLGYIYVNNPGSYLKNLVSIFPSLCGQKPLIGDEVVVLGYPGIGSKENITATEGIVSGFDGNYFITSAKVEQGNSGGAAILLKDNCLLGIPTFVTLGKVESLARILDIWTATEK